MWANTEKMFIKYKSFLRLFLRSVSEAYKRKIWKIVEGLEPCDYFFSYKLKRLVESTVLGGEKKKCKRIQNTWPELIRGLKTTCGSSLDLGDLILRSQNRNCWIKKYFLLCVIRKLVLIIFFIKKNMRFLEVRAFLKQLWFFHKLHTYIIKITPFFA